MKVRNLVSKRYKETPADCQIASQALMMRGGYIKPVGNGIFTLFPITKRITSKIEKILREEMNRIDGQEVLFPVAMPASIWRQSGRYESIGSELLRFTDRSGGEMVLGMTHEEPLGAIASTEIMLPGDAGATSPPPNMLKNRRLAELPAIIDMSSRGFASTYGK